MNIEGQDRIRRWRRTVGRSAIELETRRSTQKRGHLTGRGQGRVFLGAVLLLLWLVFGAPARADNSPWDTYNEGVRAYGKGDYAAAFQRWQDLSIQTLPRSLHRPVWFQLGNVQFRLGESLEQGSPEEAGELWRRSCEAFRSVLAVRPRDREARHNLDFVQRRLAALTHRLGLEAFRSAEDKPPDEAINLLRSSTQYLDEAVNLVSNDLQLRHDRDEAWQKLRERLKQRAGMVESQADDYVRQSNTWANQQAEDRYRAALGDLQEARRPDSTAEAAGDAATKRQGDALEESVVNAQDRVERKLSELLTRMGKREQKEGDQASDINPDEALGHYESALDLYQAAQEAYKNNAEAHAGELEVRAAMEKLYVREGRAELDRGKDALAQQSPRAASALSTALSNFESALELNSGNGEAKSGAEEARRLLPEALNLAGQTELQSGDRAEPQSPSDALAHYQEAEKDFRQSLDLNSAQPKAEQRLREAISKVARMRQRAAEEAEAAAKAGQPQGQPPRTLQSLLGQVEEKQRTPELERQRQRAQRDMRPRKYQADW